MPCVVVKVLQYFGWTCCLHIQVTTAKVIALQKTALFKNHPTGQKLVLS